MHNFSDFKSKHHLLFVENGRYTEIHMKNKNTKKMIIELINKKSIGKYGMTKNIK